MKKFFTNKVMQFVLAFALVVTSLTLFAGPVDTYAYASSDAKVFLKASKAYTESVRDDAGNYHYLQATSIAVDTACLTEFYVNSYSAETFQITVYDAAMTKMVAQSDWTTTKTSKVDKYSTDATVKLPLQAGAYYIMYEFQDYASFVTEIYRDVTTITAGFTSELKVPGQTVTAWATSNSKIATVKNGKVTAKKTGKCTVTATLANGQKINFAIKVRANKYTDAKMKKKNVLYGVAAKVIGMSYDKKGNLVVSVQYLNTRSSKSVIKLTEITVKNGSKKTVAKLKSTKKITIKANKDKVVKFTIKKSKLKNKKKQDLPKATVSISGKYTW